ncbi:MAG: hypothetical protein ACTSPY_01940 [Candidatus Helarchaeota archaeon]
MAILGLLIQSRSGLPIFFSSWSDKIDMIKKTDRELISGFFSALFSFVDSFDKKLGYVRFLDNAMEIFGIDAVCVELGNYLFLSFVDSYQFHELVKYKIRWIYNLILKKYENYIEKGKTIKLTSDEENLIESLLSDKYQKSVVMSIKNELNVVIDELISFGGTNQIYGISINSFDNSILYSFGVEHSSIELFLNNLGQKGSLIKDNEIQYAYVSIADFIPVLIVQVNPVIKFPISDIIQEMASGELPIYLNIIIDTSANVNETVKVVLEKIVPLFNSK